MRHRGFANARRVFVCHHRTHRAACLVVRCRHVNLTNFPAEALSSRVDERMDIKSAYISIDESSEAQAAAIVQALQQLVKQTLYVRFDSLQSKSPDSLHQLGHLYGCVAREDPTFDLVPILQMGQDEGVHLHALGCRHHLHIRSPRAYFQAAHGAQWASHTGRMLGCKHSM